MVLRNSSFIRELGDSSWTTKEDFRWGNECHFIMAWYLKQSFTKQKGVLTWFHMWFPSRTAFKKLLSAWSYFHHLKLVSDWKVYQHGVPQWTKVSSQINTDYCASLVSFSSRSVSIQLSFSSVFNFGCTFFVAKSLKDSNWPKYKHAKKLRFSVHHSENRRLLCRCVERQ